MKLTENFYVYSIMCFMQKHSILCSEIKKDTICRVIRKNQKTIEEGKKWNKQRKIPKKQKKRGKTRRKKPAIAPGQMRVIKRNGSVVSYDAEKIAIAITKAISCC